MAGSFHVMQNYLKIYKKIKIRVNIPVNCTDIQTEDVTYMDVSRQGRNYKEVDKNKYLHQGGFILWQ